MKYFTVLPGRPLQNDNITPNTILAGGDQSNGAMGKFYEGIMVTGETSDETDNAVQSNIVAVGYRNLY